MERYTGFYIDKPQGNNVFSYEERENKKIFVPKLIEGTLEDVKVGDNIVFNEIDEDTEIKAKGLKNLVEYKLGNKTIYVFDNHNHAFYFWNKSLLKNEFNKGCKLVHVDQHKDMREPDNYNVDIENLDDVFELLSDLEYAHYSVDKAYDVDAMVWTSVEYCLGDFVDNYNYLIEYDEE